MKKGIRSPVTSIRNLRACMGLNKHRKVSFVWQSLYYSVNIIKVLSSRIQEDGMDKESLVMGLHEYIDSQKHNLLKTLKEYINFRSINVRMLREGEVSEIVECQRWVASQLEEIGYFDKVDYYEIKEGRPNVVGIRNGSGEGRSLLFNGHSDVVIVSEEQERAWTELSPFDGGVKDGKVWGRGATDMKGGGTAMLYAAKALKELDVKLRGGLLLTFVDGEESGEAELGIWSLIEKNYTADLGIMCECSTIDTICNKSKGEIYYNIKIRGESTHICNRHKTIWPQKRREDQIGVNAIDKMVKLINAFSELERSWGLDYYHPELDPGTTTLAVSMIRGGESFSAQAGECEITIASLFSPELTVEDIRRQITGTIDYVADHDHWLRNHRPQYEMPFYPKVPLKVSDDDEAVQTAIFSYEQVMGKKPRLGFSRGVGDYNYMFEKGMKCINWGPGDAELAHGVNEYVEIDKVLTAAKIYAAMAVNWCGAS